MLSDFVGRGLEIYEELDRSSSEERDETLFHGLFDQWVRISEAIASTPASDLSEAAIKAMYIRSIVTEEPLPDIGLVEWPLIQSLIDDVARLSTIETKLIDRSQSS